VEGINLGDTKEDLGTYHCWAVYDDEEQETPGKISAT